MIARTALLIALLASPTAAHSSDTTEAAPTGRYQIHRTIAEIVDAETLDVIADMVSPDDTVSWSVHVPESYDPTRPAGLLVYISPTNRGWMPRAWSSVIDEKNLIWIAADDAGNRVPVARRMVLATVAPGIIQESYAIDPDRIYLSGFSGGGKVSGMVAPEFAHTFRGAIYVGGAAFWARDEHPYIDQIRDNRYVFVAGDSDFNLELTERIHHRYRGAGVEHIKLMIIRGMGHDTPGKSDFRRAIEFLDARD